MKVKDIDATYVIASATGRLIGDVVGSQHLGAQIVASILLPDERPTEKNIQIRLREALASGNIQVTGMGPQRLQRLRSALALGKALYASAPETGTVVDEPTVAAQVFHEIAWAQVEKFAVLALDIKHRIISQ
ncbi:MAG: hypothetical protein WA783_08130 [Phormidesmis sp.]